MLCIIKTGSLMWINAIGNRLISELQWWSMHSNALSGFTPSNQMSRVCGGNRKMLRVSFYVAAIQISDGVAGFGGVLKDDKDKIVGLFNGQNKMFKISEWMPKAHLTVQILNDGVRSLDDRTLMQLVDSLRSDFDSLMFFQIPDSTNAFVFSLAELGVNIGTMFHALF